jgi:hypothetical protein
MGLTSCKDGIYYSCNPTIDKEIKQNLPYYSNLTREEWKLLPDSLKNAAFIAMTPEVRKEFCKGKYDELMQFHLFNDDEKEHIKKLYDYVLSIDNIFAIGMTDKNPQREKHQKFFDEWMEYGINKVGWTRTDIFLIAVLKDEVTDENVAKAMQKVPASATTLKKQSRGDCDCSLQNDWCGMVESWKYCFSIECDEVKPWPACGILWLYTCDGICAT